MGFLCLYFGHDYYEGCILDYRTDPALKVRKLFQQRLVLGMPSMLFAGICLSVVLVFVLSTLLLALVWGLFSLSVMYFIHRKDPMALTFWAGAVRQPRRWYAGCSPLKKVIVVDETSDDFFISYSEFTRVNFNKRKV